MPASLRNRVAVAQVVRRHTADAVWRQLFRGLRNTQAAAGDKAARSAVAAGKKRAFRYNLLRFACKFRFNRLRGCGTAAGDVLTGGCRRVTDGAFPKVWKAFLFGPSEEL
jgi:hypothetical protein